MSKVIRFMQNYLLLGFPFVACAMIWQTFQSPNEITSGGLTTLWTALGFNLMFWFVTLILFLIILVVAPSVREKTLTRLANINERDEREQYITGRAARATYISTLSLMILLFFLSMFSVKVSQIPHKKLMVSVGLHFGLLANTPVENNSKEEVLFETNNIQLSSSATLLILLSSQLLIFNLVARREQKRV